MLPLSFRRLLVLGGVAVAASLPLSTYALDPGSNKYASLDPGSKKYADLVRLGLAVRCATERIKDDEDIEYLIYVMQTHLDIKPDELLIAAEDAFRKDVNKFVADQKALNPDFCEEMISKMYARMGMSVPAAPERALKPKRDAKGRPQLESIKKDADPDKVHVDCLNAKDYEGCVRVRSGGSESVKANEDDCSDGVCKIRTKGKDVFGLPKPPIDWWYTGWQDGVGRSYFSPVTRVKHNGEDGRYLALRRINRWYQNPKQGRSGSISSFGSSSTSCYDWGDSVSCSGPSPSFSYIPGTSSSPGGARSKSMTYVVDCQDKTFAKYDGAKKPRWSGIKNDSRDPFPEILVGLCGKQANMPVLHMSL